MTKMIHKVLLTMLVFTGFLSTSWACSGYNIRNATEYRNALAAGHIPPLLQRLPVYLVSSGRPTAMKISLAGQSLRLSGGYAIKVLSMNADGDDDQVINSVCIEGNTVTAFVVKRTPEGEKVKRQVIELTSSTSAVIRDELDISVTTTTAEGYNRQLDVIFQRAPVLKQRISHATDASRGIKGQQ